MNAPTLRPIRPPEVAILYLAQHDSAFEYALDRPPRPEPPVGARPRQTRRPKDRGRPGLIMAALLKRPARPSEIAAEIGCEVGLVSGVLGSLLRRSLVRQLRKAPGFGRSFIWDLTAAGEKVAKGEAS